ncbi:MAG: VOC family protein [Firmicutes bacterium]|nr:VOC family protein [Bacillota bacterium]
MSCAVFINFDGDCRSAVEFYAKVFKQEFPQVLTYGGTPGAGKGNDADKDRILYTSLQVMDCNLMFSDCPSGFAHVKGNNIAISLGFTCEDEARRVYAELSDGGTVHMPLGQTFFSKLFGMFRDKYGISWQVSLQ